MANYRERRFPDPAPSVARVAGGTATRRALIRNKRTFLEEPDQPFERFQCEIVVEDPDGTEVDRFTYWADLSRRDWTHEKLQAEIDAAKAAALKACENRKAITIEDLS
jgi:hypothetical protein